MIIKTQWWVEWFYCNESILLNNGVFSINSSIYYVVFGIKRKVFVLAFMWILFRIKISCVVVVLVARHLLGSCSTYARELLDICSGATWHLFGATWYLFGNCSALARELLGICVFCSTFACVVLNLKCRWHSVLSRNCKCGVFAFCEDFHSFLVCVAMFLRLRPNATYILRSNGECLKTWQDWKPLFL